MSRIFLSHSSVNEIEAVALKHWLADNGWGDEDVFLDVDPERGLSAGERWQEALRKAADRCEAVVFIVSPAWAKSKWCLAEFLLAKNLHKLIFGVVLQEVPIGELPTEMTAEWQLCHLVGKGPAQKICFKHRETTHEVEFLADGLNRLKSGLEKAGLNADFFPWPPKDEPNRAPYRGLEPLDAYDAAVFFGRDVEILRGLDVLRGMRDNNDKKLFVILGASGAGKSSFLRAGLLPRLKRDDRHFYTLPVIRPEREPIFGQHGLASGLQKSHVDLKLPVRNLGNIKTAISKGPIELVSLLQALQQAARSRLLASTDDKSTPTPTLILSIDQAEELFNVDAGKEAKDFLSLIGEVLRADANISQLPIIIIFTIRSDRYEPLQTAPELAGLQSIVYDDLKPMPPDRFREVILGPAKRASIQGGKLEVKADLVNQLLEDCQKGGDPLPLLSLTLAKLYKDYGSDGDLSLDEYEAMGGMAEVVKREAESILSIDPVTRNQQLQYLHSAFIPWLATINPENDQPMRRLAKLSDLPEDSQPLILALADKRLLLTDQRQGQTVVEVAHEALLRQWDTLTKWLQTEREELKDADILERAVQAWEMNGRKSAWLIEGERLTNAEALSTRPGFSKLLLACKEFLSVSRRRENERQEAEAKYQAERVESARRLFKRTAVGAVVAVLFGIGAGFFGINAKKQQTVAEHALGASNVMEATRRYEDGQKGQALAYLARAVRLDPSDTAWRATLTSILLRNGWCPRRAELKGREPTTAASFSPDGTKVVTIAGDEALLWNTAEGKSIGTPLRHRNIVNSAMYSPDGTLVVTASTDRSVRIWDSHTGSQKLDLARHRAPVKSASFTSDGKRIVTRTAEEMRVFNAMTGEEIGSPLPVEYSDEKYFLFRAKDNSIRAWSTEQGSQIGPDISGVSRIYTRLFSADGHRVAIQSSDGIRIINVDTGKDTSPSINPGHLKPEAFGGNGSTLLVSGPKFDAAILDIDRTGKLGQTFSYDMSHDNSYEYSLSPDNPRLSLLVKTYDSNYNKVSSAYFLDTSTWKQTGAPIEHVTLGLPKYCSDGNRAITVSGKKAYLQDSTSGKFLKEPIEHNTVIKSVHFSRDCRLLATIAGSEAHLWDARTGNPIGQSLTHPAEILSASFSPDGTLLMTVSSRGAHLWETKAGAGTGEMVRYGKDADIVKFSPNGNRVVTASGAKMQLWDMQTGALVGEDMAVDGLVASLLFSRDGSRILSVTEEGTARVWNAEKGQALGESFSFPKEYLWSDSFPVFSQNGRVIVLLAERIARIWSLETGKPIGKPLRHNAVITSADFSDDDRFLITTSEDSTAKIWSATTGESLGQPMYHDGYRVSSASFDKKGTRLVTVAEKPISRDGYAEYERRIVRVWLTESARPLGEPITHEEEITSASLSPDGNHILIASGMSARILDAVTAAPIGEPLVHDADVIAARFSPDGTRILTVSGQKAILWDAQRTTRIGEPMLAPETLSDAYFLLDGQRIITISGNDEDISSNRRARLWDVPTGTADDAPLLASIAEAISGYSVSEFGSLYPVPDASARLALLRQSLGTKVSEESSAHALVRWLLSDPWERTVAPLAQLTVAEYVKNIVNAAHADKSHEGAESDPTNNQSQDSVVADEEKELAAMDKLYPGYPGLSSTELLRKKIPDQKTDTDARQE
ncbi:WD40 repeat protein [Methylobacter tundripaludum]|uniref:WD40 repeat protein n=1 Tax=Methylobacter tundripaludum TaxID=173365 RepID=A0A2S6H914_9GAMM|nr:TIR domain-containing protein [Methylobacter tundripaludum]PPK73910.1 WD40 repeat protein [Methylobacter tundripaludum]